MPLYSLWPGDKSEVLDVDTPDLERYPDFVKACRYECILEPGDMLLIPGKVSITLVAPGTLELEHKKNIRKKYLKTYCSYATFTEYL